MDKKLNKWLIIIGLGLLVLNIIFSNVLTGFDTDSSIFAPILFFAFIAGIFIIWLGILNYNKWAMWIKILLSILLTFGTILILIVWALSRMDLSGIFS